LAMNLNVHVAEVTMAAPDRIRVAVRDGGVTKYPPIVNPAGVEAGDYRSSTTRVNPATGLTEPCVIISANKDHLKFYDTQPAAFADRAAMDNPANYPTIGGRTVTAVYRSSLPYEQSNYGNNLVQAMLEHLLYLQLDGDLPEGSYTISITGNTFPATAFTFDEKFTRCCAIGSTQLGHRPDDGSKVAYLRNWLPNGPNEGAVDFATDYGLTAFHVINTKRQTVFTGTVVEICTPTTSEASYTNTYFPSMNTPPKTATAVDTATETITVPSHGYVSGQYKFFRGFEGVGGMGAALQITVVDANTFTVSPAITGTWVPNYNIAAHDSKVYDTYLRNRYGTYVYRLDYSAFVPNDPAERYKIWIPGFGVSDEFMIHDAIWAKYLHNGLKGVYNQSIGIPLSASIGGWDRPSWGRDGVGGFEVYESMLPGDMHYENAIVGPRPASLGTYSDYITTNRVTGFRGGFADAGDHDWHVERHFPQLWTLLDISYDRVPAPARNISFGFPKASDTFDYTSIYDDIDDMPDAIHIALHYAEGLRWKQAVDGRVYSGMNFSNPLYPINPAADISDGAAGSRWDPSWITLADPHLLAADHLSNFAYAVVAAKLGKIFQQAGHTALAQIWMDSAELAYEWADTIYQGYLVNDITDAAWIAHYITRLDFKTRSGFSDTDLKTHYDALIPRCAEMRMFAVYQLYTAFASQSPDTGSAPYWAIIEPLEDDVSQTGYNGALGVWEYAQGPTGDAGFKAYYNSRWYVNPEAVYAPGLNGNRVFKYSSTGVNPWPSEPNNNLVYAFLSSEVHSPTPLPKDNTNKYIRYLQAGEGYNTGANPYDCTCVTGIGSRQPHSLFLDREATGLASSDIPGFACYMGTGAWANSAILNNLSNDSPVNFTCSNVRVGDPTGNGMVRLVEPFHHMIPHGLTHFRNSYAIYTTETELRGPIFGRFANAMFLHAWDGNTETTQPKTRYWARCS